MSSWSKRRKMLYGGVVITVAVIAVIIVIFNFFYVSPTCSDSKLNGNEEGIDCGGSCPRLCASAFLSPIVNWTRFEEIAPHVYNVAAYIVNPNIDGEAIGVPYQAKIYDNRGVIISEYTGRVTLPPHRNTLAFQASINLQERVPAKVLFEFLNTPDWVKKGDQLAKLVVTGKEYADDDTGSRLFVTLKNTNVLPLGRMSVYAVLYDKGGNALGFSKTIIDSIDAGQSVTAPFTWPINRNGEVVSIEVLPVAE